MMKYFKKLVFIPIDAHNYIRKQAFDNKQSYMSILVKYINDGVTNDKTIHRTKPKNSLS